MLGYITRSSVFSLSALGVKRNDLVLGAKLAKDEKEALVDSADAMNRIDMLGVCGRNIKSR
jgi:hypothetical protein